jgi:hypothetical protein
MLIVTDTNRETIKKLILFYLENVLRRESYTFKDHI